MPHRKVAEKVTKTAFAKTAFARTAFLGAIATLISFAIPTASQANDIAASLSPAQSPAHSPIAASPDPAGLQLAQAIMPTPGSPTLAVTGYGRAFAPADQVAILLAYTLNYYPEPPSDTSIPTPILPPTAQESDLQPVVDALVGAGIPRSDISFSREAYNPQVVRMIVRVANPSRERVNTLVQLAGGTPARESKLALTVTNLVFTARDCPATEASAREAAVADARAQATALANDTGVELGELLSVTGYGTWGYIGPSSSKCPANISEVLRYAAQYGTVIPYDPSLPLDISLDFSVSLTYSIDGQ
jgi:hypothetical protein